MRPWLGRQWQGAVIVVVGVLILLLADRGPRDPQARSRDRKGGRTTLYALLKEVQLHAVHIGRSCRPTRAELLRYVARLDRECASPPGAEIIEVRFGQLPEPDDAARAGAEPTQSG